MKIKYTEYQDTGADAYITRDEMVNIEGKIEASWSRLTKEQQENAKAKATQILDNNVTWSVS